MNENQLLDHLRSILAELVEHQEGLHGPGTCASGRPGKQPVDRIETILERSERRLGLADALGMTAA